MPEKYFKEQKLSGCLASDLACERGRAAPGMPGVEFKCYNAGEFLWERLKITTEEGSKSIGRPIGNYDTLTVKNMTELDEDDIEDASNELAKELCLMLDRLGTSPGRLLVVGLGNKNLTPDSIGPRAAEKINATMHIKKYEKSLFYDFGCSEIAVCSPGVMAKTGMEAAEIITAICDRIEPDAVLAIDSLASKSSQRLGKTIQICDTGIFPGSGIGNPRYPLNIGTLGTHVIAIGVPTVINTRMLTEREILSEITEEEMFVSPREIDEIAEISSKIIAQGINQAFGLF